ncbi:hypothetical protein AVEN_153728-1 [Araneus ventricosus]|uniref:Uncharacterized protein n=1 Tax=Araneus ventricosus TaxID=182803 RepID=A0A4Y2W261_ARAVE|nr:hypothetical protein AVEN_153728-1 [Araneus ventricosus]
MQLQEPSLPLLAASLVNSGLTDHFSQPITGPKHILALESPSRTECSLLSIADWAGLPASCCGVQGENGLWYWNR